MKILIFDRHPLLAATRGSLQEVAANLGLEVGDHPPSETDLAIFVDWHPSFEPARRALHKLQVPTALVLMEPSVVVPRYDSKAFRAQFTKVIYVGRPSEKDAIHWPMYWDTSYLHQKTRLTRFVAISSRKLSFSEGGLYWLREQAYSEISGLDVFGFGWDVSDFKILNSALKELWISILSNHPLDLRQARTFLRKPSFYLGESRKKLETLSRYKYSLVIENSLEFCSEKLMDALLAGAMPIYVGPSLRSFSIPKELVVTAEPTMESIMDAHQAALDMDWDIWHQSLVQWLSMPTTKPAWEATSVNTRVLKECLSVV